LAGVPGIHGTTDTTLPFFVFEKLEEKAKNSLLEGVTSRKGNDLEWINVSDDRFVVREKEDNCSERSNGPEEKKNNEPENPENNDECHML
jgi:hypothetical protein